MLVQVRSPRCPECGVDSEFMVDYNSYRQWSNRGTLIQQAFPDMSIHDRETLKTGYHQKCWDDAFGNFHHKGEEE